MEVWKFLGEQPFVTLFLTLGLGHLLGRVKAGFFSIGPTAGSLLVALGLVALAFNLGGVRIVIPDLLQTTFLALFTYAVGLRVGPQFVTGLRSQGVQFAIVVLVTTTAAFAIAFIGSRWLGLPPGYAPGILAGANTISAVMGVASAAVSDGAYAVPTGFTAEQVQANVAARYSLTYVFSILGIVMLVRNLPAMSLGLITAVVPTFLSWLVGLYVLRMDPIVLAGAVSGARNSTTAMKAISDEAHGAMPAFGYPVPYALSTIVFLIYGYLAMMLS